MKLVSNFFYSKLMAIENLAKMNYCSTLQWRVLTVSASVLYGSLFPLVNRKKGHCNFLFHNSDIFSHNSDFF